MGQRENLKKTTPYIDDHVPSGSEGEKTIRNWRDAKQKPIEKDAPTHPQKITQTQPQERTPNLQPTTPKHTTPHYAKGSSKHAEETEY